MHPSDTAATLTPFVASSQILDAELGVGASTSRSTLLRSSDSVSSGSTASRAIPYNNVLWCLLRTYPRLIHPYFEDNIMKQIAHDLHGRIERPLRLSRRGKSA